MVKETNLENEPVTLNDIREAWIARYWDDYSLFDIDDAMREEEGKLFDTCMNEQFAEVWGKAVNSIVDAFVNHPDQPLPENPYISKAVIDEP